MQVTENLYDQVENLRLIEVVQTAESEEDKMNATQCLLTQNAALVRSIVYRFRDRGVDIEDLIQVGTIGMIKAIRSFDRSRGTAFSTYAVPLIFGEIRRYLRDEGPIKISRYYKKLGCDLMRLRNRIYTDEGREPGIEELAMRMEVSAAEAAVALDALSPMLSLSEKAFGDDSATELGALIPDTESAEEMERLCDRIALGQAISKMPQDWQRIVLLRYYRNLTQQQTAEMLGVTQVKISREEKKILTFLRNEMLR